uniref:IF rod domain-containing protein n=1 Tax=Cebus imitator TaxID=2715852 RepID=A0A2K5RJI1_CEBIM
MAYRRPPASDGLDPSQAAARNNEYKINRTKEKEQLQGLTHRFAVFIEKVHQLETQNRALEAELAALGQRHTKPSRVGELFQRYSAPAQALLERDGLAQEVQRLRAGCEKSGGGEGAESALKAQQRDVDGATLARLDLEKKVESLLDELAFVRQVQDEEAAELLATLQASSQAAAEVDVAVAKPDLSSALREIRAQHEPLAAKNLQSAEEWYKSKFANMKEQAARSTEAMRASREEIHEYRRQLQAHTIKIEGLRGANESLEGQILELEERHNAEQENDLRNTKSKMARHLREYQDLINVKMALDIEIAAYRKLLEGEETCFSTSGLSISGLNPLPSPSYLLPSRILSSTTSKVSSTGLSLKKEEEEEEASKVASKKTAEIGESFEEILEETVISTKKTEKSNIEETTISSQKI